MPLYTIQILLYLKMSSWLAIRRMSFKMVFASKNTITSVTKILSSANFIISSMVTNIPIILSHLLFPIMLEQIMFLFYLSLCRERNRGSTRWPLAWVSKGETELPFPETFHFKGPAEGLWWLHTWFLCLSSCQSGAEIFNFGLHISVALGDFENVTATAHLVKTHWFMLK